MYEDDGVTNSYLQNNAEYANTSFTFSALDDSSFTFDIDAVNGEYQGMPADRAYEVRLFHVLPPTSLSLNQQQIPYSPCSASSNPVPSAPTLGPATSLS